MLTGRFESAEPWSPADRETVWASMQAMDIHVYPPPGGEAGRPRLERLDDDCWRYFHPNAGLCLEAALRLRARVRARSAAHHARIAIGLGAAVPGPGESLARAEGSAFERSQNAFDEMDDGRELVIALGAEACGDKPAALRQSYYALTHFSDRISAAWTPRQAETAALAWADRQASRASLAESLGVRPQTAAAHLKASGWRVLREACWVFENTKW